MYLVQVFLLHTRDAFDVLRLALLVLSDNQAPLPCETRQPAADANLAFVSMNHQRTYSATE